MNSMNLKDFRPDHSDFDDEDPIAEKETPIQSSGYHEEINTLKIDKLSNRVTIISIILPCLIGAILVFAYLDMKERVVDVDITKQTQYEKISKQIEEQLNALDIKIAKNKYDIDTTLPDIKKKSIAIEGQLTKKADAKTIKRQVAKIDKRISDNLNQNKSTNKQTLAALKTTRDKFDSTAKQIKDEITLFKDEFDARLLELSDYDQQIGMLRKDFSLLDKKQKNIKSEYISKTEFGQQTKDMDRQIKELNQKMNATLSKLQSDLDSLLKSMPSNSSKPRPQINIDSSKSTTIKQESLKQ